MTLLRKLINSKLSIAMLPFFLAALLVSTTTFAQSKFATPKKKKSVVATKDNPYPYPGPIYQPGQGIPMCAALKESKTYADKSGLKFLIPGKNDWIFRSPDFKQDFTAQDASAHYFKMLNEALEAKDQQLVILFQPSRAFVESGQIDPASLMYPYDPAVAKASFKKFIGQLNDWDIDAPDLTDIPADVEYFRRGDLHWTLEGSKWTAQKFGEFFKELDGYSDLRKAEFETTEDGEALNRGSYYDFIQKACEINIQLDEQPSWVTTEKAADSAGSLFDDTASPEIVLVGTSNSSLPTYNFAGWLKENIKADIYNVSIPGGGFGSSILRYLSSEDYIQHPPKFIIWEFLAQHNYNASDSLDDFRQMIPAVYGECADTDAIETVSVPITKDETDLNAFITHDFKNTYMFMEVTEPIERKFDLEILYSNGEGGFAEMSRDQKVANNGKYYFLLDEGLGEKAMYIRMITDNPTGHLKAKLCPIPSELVK